MISMVPDPDDDFSPGCLGLEGSAFEREYCGLYLDDRGRLPSMRDAEESLSNDDHHETP
jgi:hypothetical protein